MGGPSLVPVIPMPAPTLHNPLEFGDEDDEIKTITHTGVPLSSSIGLC